MAVNIKPINEVPEVDAVAEGDKILLNSGGVAVQIDASKVGGGGGSAAGGVVYVDLQSIMTDETGEDIPAQAFTDIEMTTPMDYETGKNILLGAGKLAQDFSVLAPGMIMYMVPSAVGTVDEARILQVGISMGSAYNLVLIFSDSIGL